jgi:hypothetical protein
MDRLQRPCNLMSWLCLPGNRLFASGIVPVASLAVWQVRRCHWQGSGFVSWDNKVIASFIFNSNKKETIKSKFASDWFCSVIFRRVIIWWWGVSERKCHPQSQRWNCVCALCEIKTESGGNFNGSLSNWRLVGCSDCLCHANLQLACWALI